MPQPTHYKLASAIEIEGVVRPAGTVITAEQLGTLPPEGQEILLRDEHVVPCAAPSNAPATPPSPFPRKPIKAKAE